MSDQPVQPVPASLSTRGAGLLCLLALSPFLAAAYPMNTHMSLTPDELFWFVVVSDSHLGMDLWGGKADTENLNWATSELVATVEPRFMVDAGDLVDGSGGGLIPLGQSDEEWQNYRAILDSNGMTAAFYHDLPGNHDQYSDEGLPHFIQYSIQGAATGTWTHAWTVEDVGAKHLFLAVATCGSDGAPWPIDNSGLDAADFAAINALLAQHQDADIVTIFGHHPADPFHFLNGLDDFLDLMVSQGVSAYVFGHTHDHSMSWKAGALQFNCASLAKSGDNQVGLLAYDGRGLSAKAFGIGEWPQVLVTAPLDSELAGNHLYDYMVPDSMEAAVVRAIAFDPDGLDAVTALLDDALPIEMSEVKPHVWQGVFSPAGMDEYPHTLKVSVTAQGETDEDAVVFYVSHDPDPPEETAPEAVEPDWDVVAEANPETVETDAAAADAWADAQADWTGDVIPDEPGQDAGAAVAEGTADATAADAPGTADAAPLDISTTGDYRLADADDDSGPRPGVVGYIDGKKSGGCTVGSASSPAALLLLVLLLAAASTRGVGNGSGTRAAGREWYGRKARARND